MNGFVEDFKNAWHKPNNTLIRLIIINVIVFVVLNLVDLFAFHLGYAPAHYFMLKVLFMPSSPEVFIMRPWTLITYFFTHKDFFGHLLFNMLGLYWFGSIIQEYMRNDRLLALYVYGGIAGGLFFMLVYNSMPAYKNFSPELMIGASASVYALVVGAATLMPTYSIHLLFFGPVQLKYLAVIYVFLSLIGSTGNNLGVGGNLAHLGGALLGYVFVRQFQKGNDWSKPLTALFNGITGIFKPRPKLKVSYKNTQTKTKKPSGKPDVNNPSQAEVDAILDKISAKGYESLTTEEKQILFKASQKKNDDRR